MPERLKLSLDCVVCRKPVDLLVPASGYARWKSGTLIQDAMPEVSAEDREMMISKTCPDCFGRFYLEDGYDE